MLDGGHRSSFAFLAAGLCLVLILSANSACGKGSSEEAGPQHAMGRGMGMGMGGGGRPTAVRVAEVYSGAIDARTTYVAETRPRADVRLAAEVAGVVESVHADLGDVVEAGQLLARIRGATFGQAVREAEASVAHADAAVLRATVDLELAERDRERAEQLQARGALTRAELDGIQGRYRVASATLELARADAQQRRARLERARIDMANTRVVAPFSGAIAERTLDPGALVNPGAQLFRVVDSASIVVRFAVPESDVARLAVGQAVEVDFDAAGIRGVEGRVDRVSPVVDPQNRTTPVEVIIAAGERARPGMFARVTATLETREDARLVPTPAIVRRQLEGDIDPREGVFVVREGRAYFEEVSVGIRSRAEVEILSGVEVGDRVVVAGHSELRDGGVVRIAGEGGPGPEGERSSTRESPSPSAASGPGQRGQQGEAGSRPGRAARGEGDERPTAEPRSSKGRAGS